jgi:SAM-dependent methyltransferase
MPLKVPTEEWTDDTVKRFWDWTVQGAEESYFSATFGDAILAIVRFFKLPADTYLDYGCGTGDLLRRFLQTSGMCYGADNSPASITRVNADFESLPNWGGCVDSSTLPSPLASSSVDLVTCLEVVEHLNNEQLERTLNELVRVTRSRGHILLTTPCEEDLASAMCYCPFCDRLFHRWQHVQSFTPADLRDRLSQRGLDVLFCRGVDVRFFSRIHTPLAPRKSPLWWTTLQGARLVDRLLKRPPLQSGEARILMRPGPNLLALARKP